MSDLTEFLLARIAEDEAGEPLYFNVGGGRVRVERAEPSERWLREVAAKRAIVAEHPDYGGYGESCARCAESAEDLTPWPCPTLRAIALPYADHPDYRDDWRP